MISSTPSQSAFIETLMRDGAACLVARLPADLLTPVGAFMRVGLTEPYAFLLESVEGGAARGRYSIIGLKPDQLWRCHGLDADMTEWDAQGDVRTLTLPKGEAWPKLQAFVRASRMALPHDLPPMAAGVFGYLGYECIRFFEDLPLPKTRPGSLPDGIMWRPTLMAVFDNVKDELIIIATKRAQAAVAEPTSGPERVDFEAARALYASAQQDIEAFVASLEQPLPSHFAGAFAAPVASKTLKPESNTPADIYEQMVVKAKDYIAAGDIFQVVLSQKFTVPFEAPAFALYRSLRRVNPAPFLVYFQMPDAALVCSSPEYLVRVRAGRLMLRPIAGTRPRGATLAEDAALENDLLNDAKERAEHLMLLDLGRNDVGRVAELGSVCVPEQFVIERYARVMHIVSQVEGDLRADRDALDALAACFPAGTVSGAPKVRAMEIIHELEPQARGPYAGCVGYFGANGDMDTCIILRTALIEKGSMTVQAGAGIVYDSVPSAEAQECINKASALFVAAELT